MAIGEILLSALLQVLFEKLASLGLDYARREGASSIFGINIDLLNKWKRTLDIINAVLDDAEDKQLSGKLSVKIWLDNVRDLAYDMEDLLDEFAIEATRAKSKAKFSIRDQVKFSFFSQHKSSRSNLNPRSLPSKTEVQNIDRRLEDIVNSIAYLSLTGNVVSKIDYGHERLQSNCLPETQFFGREKEEADILKLLTSEAKDSDASLSIVPIVGMGGIGKTALAKRLYNHADVRSCFEKRAWVCVSDVFDVANITKAILQLITELPCEDKNLNWLQVKLMDNLSGKKFLVVLDDVWNEKHNEWTTLLQPFEAGAKGSKIIVTTRNPLVVSLTGFLPYSLKELSIDNCTRLLAFHALRATNFERHPNLETICKKIAEICKGSPLAVKVLGGLLHNKENPNEWEAILNNRMLNPLTEKNDEVLQVLKLSYAHLPSYLKRCFAYCAMFPKDYEIERDELVLLWIAEGFLDGQKEKENKLRLGREYFDELVSRSFLQQSSINTSKFLMHDLLNDLAKSIAGATCFTSEESQVVGDEDDVSFDEKARYASLVSPRFITSKSLRAYARMKVLRSFILLHTQFYHFGIYISKKVLHELLTNLKYLRVLSICHCNIIEVPNSIGGLKHLRYLNLSYTKIKRLPESIGTLCKLQALILRGCKNLSMLPPNITKLVSLQFLDIGDTYNLEKMPLGISNLKNLTILSKFVIGPKKGSRLKELKNLPHLQGELFISELQKVEEVGDAVDATLCEKQGLSNLILHWDRNFGNLWNDEHQARVLHFLRPHTNIENLTISYYVGAKFPPWLDDPSYLNIVSLCLWDCPNVTSLPSLGQLPSLRELYVKGLHAVSTISSEFYGGKRPFSSLTTLKFEKMSAWKDWYVEGQEEEVPFSCLQHLVVGCCPLLVGTLPYQLDHLITLEIHSCLHLNSLTGEVRLPSLNELHLKKCNKEILKGMINLTSLTILKIENLVELVCFDHGFMSRLVKLKELYITSCDRLTYLWQDGDEMQSLTSLQKLAIKSCPQFTSFVAGEGEIELPNNLEWMSLWDCTNLEKLPGKMHTLRHLAIQDCPKITRQTIPPNDPSNNNPMSQLEFLRIYDCNSLTSLPFAKGRLPALKKAGIWRCKGVELLEEIVVESLNSLTINGCQNLGSLPQYFHMLSHLTHLKIEYCLTLEIENFPPLPNTLSHLSLCTCPEIKSLPNQWHHLTSLRFLTISRCDRIKCFPRGGLPPNLQTLKIMECKNLKEPVREWGLPMLRSLECLIIDFCMGGEGEKKRFPSEEGEDVWSLLFPSSLTKLSIYDMKNVKRLSTGLHNRLSSLRMLDICGCPKLRYLPEDGLPPSLHQLLINQCKILTNRCSKPNGAYWPLIQKIPKIEIEGWDVDH